MRIAAIVAWFAIIILPHGIFTLLGRRDAVPPLFLSGVGWLAGLRIRLSGRPAAGKVLLIANHVSWLDIMALARAARAIFVAKVDLAGHGFLKFLCEQNDTVFITRDQRGTVKQQIDLVREAIAERPLVIFPEGTTGDGKTLAPFKSSLLAAAERLEAEDARVVIQPVALAYREASAIAWTVGEAGLDNVMRLLARIRPIDLNVRFCEPLHGSQLADRKAMAQASRQAIETALLS